MFISAAWLTFEARLKWPFKEMQFLIFQLWILPTELDTKIGKFQSNSCTLSNFLLARQSPKV